MAGAINLTEVDFNQIKDNLISYLKSTKQFTDYDFDGSNLQVILNLIAYQAQLNAYNTNMVANESFLSSASVRSNVVANARMLGYNPSPSTSATTQMDCQFQLSVSDYPSGFPRFCQMEPGFAFMTKGSNGSLMFNVIDTQTAAVSPDGVAFFVGLDLYEGLYLTAEFTVDESIYNQKFVINNELIDTSTLRVLVKEDPNQEETVEYTNAKNYTKVKDTDRVYWVEEVENGYTQLVFGDGLFGRKLQNSAGITVRYIVSTGEVGNGIRGTGNFNFSGVVRDSFGTPVTTKPTITSVDPTQGGTGREDIASIKFRAPRDFAAQNRAVSKDDYSSLVKRAYPGIDDIYVFGGEELDPPQFGRIFIVVKPTSADALSAYAKDYILEFLQDYRVASMDIRLIDPEVIYVEAIINAYYDNKISDKTSSAISAEIKSSLTDYANSPNISKFGSAAKFSQIVGIVDDSDTSITRNNSELRMRRDAVMAIDTAASCEICFENAISTPKLSSGPAIYSTGFQKLNSGGQKDNITYYFDDDGEGNLVLYYFNAEGVRVNTDENFGTVDYTKGEIMFGYVTPVTVVNTSVVNDILQVRAYPQAQDVLSQKSVSISFDVNSSDIVSIIDTNVSKSKS